MNRKTVGSIVYSDDWKGHNALDVAGFSPIRINHSKCLTTDRHHINAIKNVWNQAKQHLHRFNTVPSAQFGLYLKACEWRFNYSDPINQLK